MDCRWDNRGEAPYDDCSAASGEAWFGGVVEELVEKVFGLNPSDPDTGWASGSRWEGICCRCFSVIVLEDDACEGDDGGRAAAVWLSAGCWGGGEGELGSSSGFAMRSPPRDCDRLRSPFIMAAAGQREWVASEGRPRAGARGGRGRRCGHYLQCKLAAMAWEGPEAKGRGVNAVAERTVAGITSGEAGQGEFRTLGC